MLKAAQHLNAMVSLKTDGRRDTMFKDQFYSQVKDYQFPVYVHIN